MTKTGYQASDTCHFYKLQPFLSIEEIRVDIVALEKEIEGLFQEIIGT